MLESLAETLEKIKVIDQNGKYILWRKDGSAALCICMLSYTYRNRLTLICVCVCVCVCVCARVCVWSGGGVQESLLYTYRNRLRKNIVSMNFGIKWRIYISQKKDTFQVEVKVKVFWEAYSELCQTESHSTFRKSFHLRCFKRRKQSPEVFSNKMCS